MCVLLQRLLICGAISSGGSNVYRWPHGPGRWSSQLKAEDPYEVSGFKEVAETIKRLWVELFQMSNKAHFVRMTSSGTFNKQVDLFLRNVGGFLSRVSDLWLRDYFETHLSAWPSRSRPYTRVDCPPSGSTHPLWRAASYTQCTQSSEGDRRNPALSAPPDSAVCPADTPRTSSRTSCRWNTCLWCILHSFKILYSNDKFEV